MAWALNAAIAALVLVPSCGEHGHVEPCGGDAPHLLVDTAAHRLWACEGDRAAVTFGVRLGKGGVGKTREGDGKVPLGEYPLGKPRASAKYGTFIEIGYPTAEQRREGYTGGAVGVHGPERRLTWLGRVNNWLDTTDGCIGLATDSEMKRIADWITASNAKRILLR
jgi:murein L,D-transpeptidase YafK